MKHLTIIILCLLLSSNMIAQHWNVTELSPMPEPISNNAVCEGFVNGVPYVYSFGGIDNTKIASGIHLRSYRFNTITAEWGSIPELPDDMGKIAASANRIGDIIYIIGGYYVFGNGSEISSNKVHRYNTQTNTYLPDGSPIPIPIDDQVQVVYQNKLIYVISGWSNSQNVTNVQIYNPEEDSWESGTSISNSDLAVFGAAGTILGDTIYFYGGAKNGNFSIVKLLRKGIINPNNPAEIQWSSETLSSSLQAYRPAATTINNEIYFLGGSDKTYNFDGLAYTNGQGVDPNNRSLLYSPEDGSYDIDQSNNLPMDLRGIANVSDTIKYLVGGMLSNQTVTDKTLKLSYNGVITSLDKNKLNTITIDAKPNPAKTKIHLEIPLVFNCKDLRILITDIQGNRVKSISSTNCSEVIDINSLVAGNYYIVVSDGRYIGKCNFIKIN